MKLEKDLHITQYDNCRECQYCEFPNDKGEISIPDSYNSCGAILRISKTVKDKNGRDIPNPILARCGVDGKKLKSLEGCNRWFNGTQHVLLR